MAITYNDLYLEIRRQLRAADSGDPTLEARELVAFACGKTKEELLRDSCLYVTPEVEARVRALVQRHLDGEPTAYLIGEWEFYGLPLDISKDVLIPRPDTEVLAGLAIDFVKTQGACRVLDLCAGSGCIGLAVASQCPESRVVLGELSEGALRICRQNIRRNGLSGRVVPMQMDALAAPPAQLGEFRCLVSNPPYIPAGDIPGLDPSVRDYEPHMALDCGADGLDFYRNLAREWKNALTVGGKIFLEVGIGQADDVLRLLRAQGFGDLEITKDLNGIPRVVHGTLWGEI